MIISTSDIDPKHGLTKKEKEIIVHLANKLSWQEITAVMSVSHKTVWRHYRNITKKICQEHEKMLLSAFEPTSLSALIVKIRFWSKEASHSMSRRLWDEAQYQISMIRNLVK